VTLTACVATSRPDGVPKAALLEVRDLRTHFFTRRGTVLAVDGISFDLRPGEALGVVGESGSGKSMACLSIMRMVPGPAGRIVSGEIRFDGVNLLELTERQMRGIRGHSIAMITQDPMTSLDPLFTIGDQVAEPMREHLRLTPRAAQERVIQYLELLRISEPALRARQYPHEASGGMRQRVVAAMGLAGEPRLLIADEPTTSLDPTVQVQFLELLRDIRVRERLAVILVSHDLNVVARLCDRVLVMYAGRIVEAGTTQDIFEQPQHPYTRALLAAARPTLHVGTRRMPAIAGQPPDPAHLPAGCAFHPRCPAAMDVCTRDYPPVATLRAERQAACWLVANPEGPANG
jgi:oligopeptide/dipeptide ABC transporter ATP-binding protein